MRFKETYEDWTSSRITQEDAARILGVSDRTFRRYISKYEEEGIKGITDKRLSQTSHKKAPKDETAKLEDLYRSRYDDFNVAHFYRFYKSNHRGLRSYTWVKNTLQANKLVSKSSKKGKHRKRRPRAPLPGMMIHQDGSTHEWVEGKKWDLIITLDDATSEHYSMFFVDEEGTASSFLGVKETIEKKGLFSSLYTDRGSHYWSTPEAGGKVDKIRLTQFGRSMRQLGIEMIPSYSPQARGRCERMFSTHQERLPKELKLKKITNMANANKYLKEVYLPAFNEEFSVSAREEGSAFVESIIGDIDNILCEQYERVVNNDNSVEFNGVVLQIPANIHRFHYVKVKVRVNRYINGNLAIFHGQRRLAFYDSNGGVIIDKKIAVAA